MLREILKTGKCFIPFDTEHSEKGMGIPFENIENSVQKLRKAFKEENIPYNNRLDERLSVCSGLFNKWDETQYNDIIISEDIYTNFVHTNIDNNCIKKAYSMSNALCVQLPIELITKQMLNNGGAFWQSKGYKEFLANGFYLFVRKIYVETFYIKIYSYMYYSKKHGLRPSLGWIETDFNIDHIDINNIGVGEDLTLQKNPHENMNQFFNLAINLELYFGSHPEWIERIQLPIKEISGKMGKRKRKELELDNKYSIIHKIGIPKQIKNCIRAKDFEGESHKINKRFMVRGHWRNQVCGQGRQERRLKFIAPFWKGTDEMPLIEHVYKIS